MSNNLKCHINIYFVEQSSYRKANRFSASQEIPPHSMEPEWSLPLLQESITCPYSETNESAHSAIPLSEDPF
jgi:hypothetical protein